jgi:hypothetical protein
MVRGIHFSALTLELAIQRAMKIPLLAFNLDIPLVLVNKILFSAPRLVNKTPLHQITHISVTAQAILIQQALKMLFSDRSQVFTIQQVTIP